MQNKFVMSQSDQCKQVDNAEDSNLEGFKKDKSSIIYNPKSKNEKNIEKLKKIGKREKEAWPVDKVICIRFEVWGERKKLIDKGQLIDHKKEEKGGFEKEFFGNANNYLSNFAVVDENGK